MATYPKDYKEWLAKLISFDTVTRNSNLGLIHYVKEYLESVGIASTLVYKPGKTHANLWATLPGEGGVTQGGIILSGHTDVVPVDGQQWDTNPFEMVEKDGKLYGRGTCDMKSFLAVVMALTPAFLSMKHVKPIHYAFSCDEEIGCTGVLYLIDYLKQKGFKADCCLVGEPTNMKVFTGNKGSAVWNVKVHGKAIHSSMALMNTSCNAIEYAAMIVAKVREIALDLKKNGPQDPQHSCPFSCISTGLIKGGNAVNTVPADCEFVFSVRFTDTKVADIIERAVSVYINDTVVPAMRQEYAEASVEMARTQFMPAFNANEDDPFTKTVRKMCNDYEIRKIGGGTEGGFFQEDLGIPTVVVGAGSGSTSTAHLPNEYVLASLVEASMNFTLELVTRYTTTDGAQAHL